MLSEEEKREIETEIPHYAQKQAVCIDAMKIVQRHRGWVSDEAIDDLAEYLEMTSDELESVASFYNLLFRQPVGRHTILLCNSISCWIKGYNQLHAHLKERLGIDMGETTPDKRFTLLPMVCLGICDHAPAMMIDDDTYVDLDMKKVDEALENYS